MDRVKAKKHLGQHFLNDPSVADKTAASIDLHLTEGRVLEIGPGTGILTRALLAQNPSHLQMIEIDKESVQFLKKHYPDLSSQLIEGDFLKLPVHELFSGKSFILAGNFPYNISSQILFRVFENHLRIPQLVGMFQKEVAERICASPGNKTYGILSVLLGIYYHAEYLFTVNANAFSPPPKVMSGVLKLTRNDRSEIGVTDHFFKNVVKTAFNQRRKTLRNSLKSLLPAEYPEDLGEVLSKRPEQLSPEEFLKLATRLSEL
jgi:16S rRNA (adenine1518-N6/adenine1519-N6)-dimethyltransferase